MKNKGPLSGSSAAFSMVELMTATAIFTVILYALVYALDATLGVAGQRISGIETRGDLRSVFETMRRDLEAVVVDRPSPHSYGNAVPEPLSSWVSKRKFIPIEINRTEGKDLTTSFLNAEKNFSSLLLASVASAASYQHPVRENLRMSGNKNATFRQSPDALSEVCLVGYYVAYTRDSDQPNSRFSMKLYRHFRSGGVTYGDGHANGILSHASDVFNPASPRTVLDGKSFQNKDLPFVLTGRYKNPNQWVKATITQPWPKQADLARLPAPPGQVNPPKYDRDSWLDPGHPVHEFVFGDQPVARNVVDFKCTPYKKVETGPNTVELFSAERLNQHLGLSNKEWPALIKPDLLDISLSIVGMDAAVQMDKKEDWTLPPGNSSATSSLSEVDRLKRQHLRRFSLRIQLN